VRTGPRARERGMERGGGSEAGHAGELGLHRAGDPGNECGRQVFVQEEHHDGPAALLAAAHVP